jgi:transcriptional regulator with XRE-family HTH domain
MGRGRTGRQRRTPRQVAADDASEALMRKLGAMLRDGRARMGLKQLEAATAAGISRSEWSELERGKSRATLHLINRAGSAVNAPLDAFLRHASAADLPRDASQLKGQELLIVTAQPGGWQGLPEEQIDRDARTSRAADVLLFRERELVRQRERVGQRELVGQRDTHACEYALMEIIDWFHDVGEPLRAWSSRLAAVERYAIARMHDDIVPITSGCWVVRATQRNRRLVADHANLFRARFPGSGRAWLAALTNPAVAMPTRPSLLWINVKGDRLFPVRWRS